MRELAALVQLFYLLRQCDTIVFSVNDEILGIINMRFLNKT